MAKWTGPLVVAAVGLLGLGLGSWRDAALRQELTWVRADLGQTQRRLAEVLEAQDHGDSVGIRETLNLMNQGHKYQLEAQQGLSARVDALQAKVEKQGEDLGLVDNAVTILLRWRQLIDNKLAVMNAKRPVIPMNR